MSVTHFKPFDPREQAVIARPADDQFEIVAVQEGLFAAVQKYGAGRVTTWLRNMAALAGQGTDLDRPTDRCLSDGAVLVNHICVQCGRDNS